MIFLLVGVLPLSVLGVMSYRRAESLPGMDPGAAAQVMGSLLVSIVFIAIVGSLTAVGLALVVASSVATPLREVQGAMGEVERGNLETRCAVVTNDEIGAAAEGFNRMVGGLREREVLKETFGKYVSREIRDEILAGRVSLEGQAREVTILFADLRDFTPWVEATSPREVVRDLNAYFTEMDGAIREHGGLVLQFIGDEIEAAFGAPWCIRSTRRRRCGPPSRCGAGWLGGMPRARGPARLPCATASGSTRARCSPATSAARSGLVRPRRRSGQPRVADPEPQQGI